MEIQYLKDRIQIDGQEILLADIIKKCNDAKISKEEIQILKIQWWGRGGEAYEWRALPKKSVVKLKKLLVGKYAYFGEIWGKHSEVYGDISEGDITIVTDKKEVENFIKQYPSGVLYNHSFIYAIFEGFNEYDEKPSAKLVKEIEQIRKLIS